jgi:uncharacterized protein YutE (UPF0331/DUF86 family)
MKKMLIFLEQETEFYNYFSKFTFSDYETDPHKRRDVERWVENMVNSSIDIGRIIISSLKRRVPDYYRISF